MQIDKNDVRSHITDLFQHLYDIVYLRSHVLTDFLIHDDTIRRKEKAWRLHHLLLDMVEELNPGKQAPSFSREARRYQLMVLRYIDGLDPQKVSNELSISRRQFYREHDSAIEAIADILWDRYFIIQQSTVSRTQTKQTVDQTNTIEILRSETKRITQVSSSAQPAKVLHGIFPLLEELLQKHQCHIDSQLLDDLPSISMNENLLRQLLLGSISFLIQQSYQATIDINAQVMPKIIVFSVRTIPPILLEEDLASTQENLTELYEIAQLGGVQFNVIHENGYFFGLDLNLPYGQHTILVVDDNDDVLELMQRYLIEHKFQVITARSAQEAISILEKIMPDVITVDLMMPGKDGWDLMQTLLNQKETNKIPIIVCSVLKQRELAISLGAAEFIEKPIQEHTLIAALESILG